MSNNKKNNVNNKSKPTKSKQSELIDKELNDENIIDTNHENINGPVINNDSIEQQENIQGESQTVENEQVKNNPPEIKVEQFIDQEPTNSHHKENSIKVKKLTSEIQNLKISYSNLQEENLKLKRLLEDERKQFLLKVEEKSKKAQELIDNKEKALEISKKEEIEKVKHSFIEEMLNEFLDPILLFESTITNSSQNPNPAIAGYLQGYVMIINMFNEKLDSLGVSQINVKVGDDFNENFMTAFDVEENTSFQPNKVVKIVKKGFVYNNKIIKYVSVVVSK
ncbi:MAG: nucleotide exchange factor GrpE [Mycoplasma sp.]